MTDHVPKESTDRVVVVAHPGSQHSYQLAVALQEAGLLDTYITRVYWDPARTPYRLLRRVPILGNRVEQRAIRRRHPKLDTRLVTQVDTWLEFLHILLQRTGRRALREWVLFRSQRRFAKRAARLALTRRSRVYVGYDTSALEAFRLLQAVAPDVTRVLDLSHPHVQGKRILREEAALHPEWAGTIDAPLSDDEITRCLLEERLADVVIVASSFSKECLVKDGVDPARIVVIPYGVDLDRFKPRPKDPVVSRPVRALFVGAVGQRKGVFYLLEAMQMLRGEDVELVIAGLPIGDRSILERWAGPNVQFRGRVSEQELEDLYRTSDVFVLPSLVEGFGLVLLEAMAAGLPIIATPHTAAPDLIRDGEHGFIVPIRDPVALADRLRWFVGHREELARMSQLARAVAEKHPWSRYWTETAAVIKSLVIGC